MRRSDAPSSAGWRLPRSPPCSWFRSSTPCCGASFPLCTRSTSASRPKLRAHRLEVLLMPEGQPDPELQSDPGAKPKLGRSLALYAFGVAAVVVAGLAAGYFHFKRDSGVANAREARA